MNRLRSWWAGRSKAERTLVALGAPLAVLAALWGNLRSKRTAAAALDAEGTGPETTPALPAAAGGGVLNAGAPGVGADQLAAFANVFTGEVGAIEGRLAAIEGPTFGDSPAVKGAIEASQAAQQTTIDQRFAGVDRANTATRTQANKAAAAAQAAATTAAALADRDTTRRAFVVLFGVPPSEAEDTAHWKRRIAAGHANVAQGLTPTGKKR